MRPGNQINRTVNTTQSTSYTEDPKARLVGSAQPSFDVQRLLLPRPGHQRGRGDPLLMSRQPAARAKRRALPDANPTSDEVSMTKHQDSVPQRRRRGDGVPGRRRRAPWRKRRRAVDDSGQPHQAAADPGDRLRPQAVGLPAGRLLRFRFLQRRLQGHLGRRRTGRGAPRPGRRWRAVTSTCCTSTTGTPSARTTRRSSTRPTPTGSR